MSRRLTICEVGLRDGLQNDPTAVSTEGKLRLHRALRGAGLAAFEVTSFVSPRAVPQMADAAEVMAGVADAGGRQAALVINEKGYDRAIAAGARAIALVVVVTESLGQKNSRMSVADALVSAARILARAGADGVHRRVYLAPAFVCPYEGAVPVDRVLACGDAVCSAGVDELAIADTLGHAEPRQVGAMFELAGARYGIERVAAHLHDTQALGLANAAAAIAAGVRTVDAAIGGLGGCPFAPGAAGNLATEDLALLADKLGFETGVSLPRLWQAVEVAGELVGRRVGGRTGDWWRARAEAERAA